MAMLSAFNPHEMSEATVRKVATGREDALADILRTIRGNIDAQTIQHLILSGPRGYGKSFLLRHVQIEAQRIAREEGLPLEVLLMPEEMPFVKLPETLIHELARALTDGAASEAKLAWREDEDSAFEKAARALSAAIRKEVGDGGLCVALVENFDRLLPRAFPKESQRLRLRAFLTESGGRLMLIAASASGAFDRDYDAGLFQAFREVALEPWSLEECLAFFARQREEAGQPPLNERESARAKAVATFIGGTPRLATMLGDVLLGEDVLGAADLLRKLVDELTPYYKERIEALPGRSQILLDALLRGGEPATQSELAKRVGASGQGAIAGPFHDLARERIVIGVKASRSAEVLYRVADRVFAHYYRFRIVEHGNALCPLEALVDLLAEFYSPDEKHDKAGEFARLGRLDEARVMARLSDAERGKTQAIRFQVLYELQNYYWPRRLSLLASETVAASLSEVARIAFSGNLDDARRRIGELLGTASRAEDRVAILLMRTALDAYEGFAGGLLSADEAVTIASAITNPKYLTEAELGRAFSLGEVGRHQDALAVCEDIAKRARANDDKQVEHRALRGASESLARLLRYSEAVEAAERSAVLAREDGDARGEAAARCAAAQYLTLSSRYAEALDAAKRSAALAREVRDVHKEAEACKLVAWNLGQLRRDWDALDAAERSAALAHEAGDVRGEAVARCIAARSQNRLGSHPGAGQTARLAVASARRVSAVDLEAECLAQEAIALTGMWVHDVAAARFLEVANVAKRTQNWKLRAGSYRLAAVSFGYVGRAIEGIEALAGSARILEAHKDESEEKLLVSQATRVGRHAVVINDVRPSDVNASVAASQFHTWLSKLAAELDFGEIGGRTLRSWLSGCVEAFLYRATIPNTLETLAEAIAIHFPERFADQRRRLTDAAHYHRSGRVHAALERVDPDFARVLATMHPPRDDDANSASGEKSRKGRVDLTQVRD